MHYQVAKDHGFTAIADFKHLDEDGSMTLPVIGGTRLKENYVGAAFADYDSYLVLSHFKGHSMAGFGGAIKNISIGFGSGETGKANIHTGGAGGSMWSADQDSLLEAMGDAGKSVSDYLENGERIVYVSVINRLSVFAKEKIHKLFSEMRGKKWGVLGVIPASLLGILSPLCMYGTIPIAASFAKKGMREDWLAAFMMSSVLLNPQLMVYSAALGKTAMLVRLISCILCGVIAGVCIALFFPKKSFFDFNNFEEHASHDTDPNIVLRLLKNIGRNIKATGGYFLFGILLSALFQRYVSAESFTNLFGTDNEGFGVLMAATIGVPLYACGGGTIPLLQAWLLDGMSMGSAASFMITGPATKITNLGALKSGLGLRHFLYYILFVMMYALISGVIVNAVF